MDGLTGPLPYSFRREPPTQAAHATKAVPPEPRPAGCLDVVLAVVDEADLLGGDLQHLGQAAEEDRVGLAHPQVAGGNEPVDATPEVVVVEDSTQIG
jgi:hypothetical protein